MEKVRNLSNSVAIKKDNDFSYLMPFVCIMHLLPDLYAWPSESENGSDKAAITTMAIR